MSSRKRKHFSSAQWQTDRTVTERHDTQQSSEPTASRSSLLIQAHEAELVRGHRAKLAAQALEMITTADGGDLATGHGASSGQGKSGDGLIRWGGDHGMASAKKNTRNQGDALQTITDESDEGWQHDISSGESVWMDRCVSSQRSRFYRHRQRSASRRADSSG